MSDNKQYAKYDSDSRYINWAASLAKDPEIRETPTGALVRLTFVDTSKAESDEEMWIEATPRDSNAEIAKFLKKGDIIGIEGKLTMRKYGENKERVAFNLRRAELHLSKAFIKELKARGFVPGTKTATPPKGTPTRKKEVLNLDDE